MVFKVIPFLVPLLAFFLSSKYLPALPAVATALALFPWFVEPREPPRISVWGAVAFACVVAYIQESASLGLAVGLPLAAMVVVELVSRTDAARGRTAALGGMVVLGIAAVVLPAAARPSPLVDGSPKRIVVIGDSLSAFEPPGGRVWPEHLATEFGAEIVNLSQGGDTLGSSWQRWGDRITASRWSESNPEWQPDLIILLLGGNDVLRKQSITMIEQDLRQWATRLEGKGAEVLLVAVPGALLRDRLPSVYRDVAKEHGFALMTQETLRSVFTNRTLTVDGIHLNAAGAEFFAARVAERIRGE